MIDERTTASKILLVKKLGENPLQNSLIKFQFGGSPTDFLIHKKKYNYIY